MTCEFSIKHKGIIKLMTTSSSDLTLFKDVNCGNFKGTPLRASR